MNRLFHICLARCWLLAFLIPPLVGQNALAAKVTLDPSNWGLEAGQACIDCHKKSSAGLTREWREGVHAEVGVNCLDCHKADAEEDDAIEHEGEIIATIVSPRDCGRCHETEYKQQLGSVHSNAVALMQSKIPSLAGGMERQSAISIGCAQCHGSRVVMRGDGTLNPEGWPNTGIGRINPDGSRGSCTACHSRHRFSKAQAREPEVCTRCHTGIESPDAEIYASSKHGMLYASNRDKMNFDSDQWVTGKDYSAAPTCVTCHMGASPGLKSTHDVGMRDAWNLNTPVSEQQYLVVFEDGDKRELPASEPVPRRGSSLPKLNGEPGKVKAVASPKRRRQAMSKVCLECHSKGFTSNSFRQFDNAVKRYNLSFGEPAQAIMNRLYQEGMITPERFDEPIEIIYWELWHNEGTRARHAAAMGSPNHLWWNGLEPLSRKFYWEFLPQVRQVAGDNAQALIDEFVDSSERQDWISLRYSSSPTPTASAGETELNSASPPPIEREAGSE